MANIDQSLEQFEAYLNEFESLKSRDLSEADTRSKVIDKLFLEVLNWKENDIIREGNVDNKFYDYKFSLPGFHMLIEAKKKFINFQLPTKHKNATIKTLLRGNDEIIKQIRSYAVDSGVPNGIITNGEQLIIGKFINTDGTDYKTNKCLIFNGFSDIRNRFVEFYNNLSREAIIQNGGFSFDVIKIDIAYNRIITSITDRDKELIRNNLSIRLTPIIDRIFGEIFIDNIEDDLEFIQKCFVETLETKKNRDEIERLFEDNAPSYGEVNPTKNTNNLISEITNELDSHSISIKEAIPPKPIIIVGSKGAGKSTFINYLFKTKLDLNLKKKFPFVYIDFRKYYDPTKSFEPKLIIDDILRSLYEKYPDLDLHSMTALKRIYYFELLLQDKSYWKEIKIGDEKTYNLKVSEFLESKVKDSILHFEMLSKYLIRDRSLRLIVIVDNADQFDLNVQESIFLFASALNKKSHCGVIVSLREGYYYKWRNSPPFDAYESNVYHVTVPHYAEILQKRINYSLVKLNERTLSNTSDDIKIQAEYSKIIEFLSSIKNSIFEDSNKDIIEFLKSTTFPNIREGLKVFKMFLTSGHTNVQEYIERELYKVSEQTITIPIHEFVKAIGLNNKLYYNHDHSLIKNIFYPVSGSTNHFLKSMILRFLFRKFKEVTSTEKHEQYNEVCREFKNLGYRLTVIQQEILELLKFGLIESENIISDTDFDMLPSENFNITISSKGFYYLTNLINRFHYLDLVLQDVPIYDKNYFDQLLINFPHATDKGKRYLFPRKQTIDIFLKYLKHTEEKESKEVFTKYGSLIQSIKDHGLNHDLINIDKLTGQSEFSKFPNSRNDEDN